MAGPELSPYELDTLVICSVRYALGRMTYVVYEVTSLVRKYLGVLDRSTLKLLLSDIEKEQERGNLGMNCDIRDWENLARDIKKEQERRTP